jgi:hypothetical protein
MVAISCTNIPLVMKSNFAIIKKLKFETVLGAANPSFQLQIQFYCTWTGFASGSLVANHKGI